MKTKLSLLLLFVVANSMASVCCPVWLVGKLYVVDENNRPLNVKIWRHYSAKDSSLLLKDRFRYDRNVNHDTNAYEFWNGGYRSYSDNSEYNRYLRIQVEGYTDVIIRRLEFDYKYGTRVKKVMFKMYPRKFVKTGDRITLINQFVCDNVKVDIDSMVIDMKDYSKSIEKAKEASLLAASSMLSVESYPNPVTNYLILKINAEIKEPYQFKLLDAEGKVVTQNAVSANVSNVDLQWISKGHYVLMVYDPKGKPVLARNFIKI